MRGMPFAGESHAGIQLLLQQQQQGVLAGGGKVSGGGGFWEPTSVLDLRHSPSPSPPVSSAASTLSSSEVAALAGGDAKNVSPLPQQAWPGGEDAAGVKEEWAHQLAPLDNMGLAPGDDWADDAAAPPSGPDSSFLRWIIAGGEDGGVLMDPPVLELDHATSMMSSPAAAAFGPPNLSSSFAPAMEETKPQPAFGHGPGFLLHHPQPHAAFFGSHPSFDSPPTTKRHHPMAAAPPPKLPPYPSHHLAPASGGGGFVLKQQPKAAAASQDEAAAMAAVEQLAEAAKLAEAGDAHGAREILARLNYRLPAAPAAGNTPPLLRSAFYFKEALRLALSTPAGEAYYYTAPPASTPYDVVLKLGAYKAFSEASPVLPFAHLTCVQAVLDELGDRGCVHVLDFDIGMGEQWASLMQELASSSHRRGTSAAAALKVTALVSPATHHPLELQLIHENLSSFAADLGVLFQFSAFNVETLDPADLVSIVAGAGDEALAVHLPVGAAHAASTPAILRLVKRLGAKVVVAVDRGGDRAELPFAAHLFQAFQSAVFLLESIDAVLGSADPDTAGRVERFLVQPAVEQCVVARHRDRASPGMMPWRAVFAAAGFAPAQASTFAESQAESLLHKVPVRGFRVERRAPGSLCLYWQRAELVSVSAWRC